MLVLLRGDLNPNDDDEVLLRHVDFQVLTVWSALKIVVSVVCLQDRIVEADEFENETESPIIITRFFFL